MPPELAQPVTDAFASTDWATVVLAAAITAVAWGSLVTLGGMEGWVLLNSLSPWIRGFAIGAGLIVAGGCVLLFWALEVPPDHTAARVAVGVVAGVGGLFAARLAVGVFWRTWRLRVFLSGGLLAVAAFLVSVLAGALSSGATLAAVGLGVAEAFVAFDADGNWSVRWLAVGKCAAAFVLGGGLYLLAYCLLFPALWFVRNAALIAAGAVLLVLPDLRHAASGFLAQTVPAEAVWAHVMHHRWWALGLAGGAAAIVGYAMWTQRFAGKFRHFVRKVVTAERGAFGMLNLLVSAVGTVFETLGRMATLRRADAERCRLFPPPEAEQEPADQARAKPH